MSPIGGLCCWNGVGTRLLETTLSAKLSCKSFRVVKFIFHSIVCLHWGEHCGQSNGLLGGEIPSFFFFFLFALVRGRLRAERRFSLGWLCWVEPYACSSQLEWSKWNYRRKKFLPDSVSLGYSGACLSAVALKVPIFNCFNCQHGQSM